MNKKERIEVTIINSNGLCINNNNPSLEKKADELFEELGYKKIRNNKDFEVYRKNDYNIIDFERDDKRVYKSAKYDTTSDGITMKELQAINKKCQELGWI